ncbi:acyl carrier protein [Streptomyces sp. NPDC017248]|uniref:acyl carrier protein n=1 Tax=unclassified Streptomyces TaxID=2593676 RepID=UPI0037926290
MKQNDSRSLIREFISPHVNGQSLADDDDFFALGYVNSLFAMQLMMFLQNEFKLVLTPADMHFDNFRSVNGLVRLVTSKATA